MKVFKAGVVALLMTVTLFGIGCVGQTPVVGRAVSVAAPDFFGISEQLALQLRDNHRDRLAGERLLMTTFVPLDSFTRPTSLGRLLAESLSTRLFSHQAQVLEIRKGREVVVVDDRGEMILTRDASRLATKQEVSAIVAGTYSLTPQTVIVNVRLLAAGSHEVLSVAGLEFARSEAINALLTGGTGLTDSELSVIERHGG